MGRHSRKDPAPARVAAAPAPAPAPPEPGPYPDPYDGPYPDPYEDRYEDRYGDPFARRRPEPTVAHQGFAPRERPAAGARTGGHPEQQEPGGAWGSGSGSGPGSVYGDWQGVPRATVRTAAPASVHATRGAAPGPARSAVLDSDTPAFGTPAVGFPQINLTPSVPLDTLAPSATLAPPVPRLPEHGFDPVTSTGSHRQVPRPRKPAEFVEPAVPAVPAEAVDVDEAAVERPGSGRGLKVRTFTGLAAVAVTTVLAVVIAGQVASEDDTLKPGPVAAPGGAPTRASDSHVAGSRSEERVMPQAPAAPAPAPELTYEQKMAQQLPIDAKLAGPGTFDTVPGVAKAPGKGRLVRYRVDVEQALGLDPQLFAEAVHRTLNDPRSWSHGGARTFERVPGGEADFVITLASPGTTAFWCAKSSLDTTVDNVSCDSASTDRVMINAFRWAQGSATYGPDQMFAYRQMLINHEVGHRLGNGHVSCRTPGSLAPIMQQQTKSLDIDGIQCKPNPWVFPGG
ncbi:DUF3152 domain-containing protein [Streptomyces sp. NPDC058622]|uniref:DUF3152 domain-containing protein n=1 Tax=Streptomyces sp. NPDC058622 TaxID=3346562 RepID=UPI00365C1F0B